MDEVHINARYDWLAELGGALAPGVAAGFAAFKLAPSFGIAPAAAMAAAAIAAFGLGLVAMRMVKPQPRNYALAGFEVDPIDNDELLLDVIADEALLLEDRYEEPLLLDAVADDAVLLLDDPLVPDPQSRVVQLFAKAPPLTPGQLKKRIDRHLAAGVPQAAHNQNRPVPDASDALYAALADLRRSLR